MLELDDVGCDDQKPFATKNQRNAMEHSATPTAAMPRTPVANSAPMRLPKITEMRALKIRTPKMKPMIVSPTRGDSTGRRLYSSECRAFQYTLRISQVPAHPQIPPIEMAEHPEKIGRGSTHHVLLEGFGLERIEVCPARRAPELPPHVAFGIAVVDVVSRRPAPNVESRGEPIMPAKFLEVGQTIKRPVTR